MKAVLIYDLPDDADEFNAAVKALNLYFCLWDLDQFLRDQIKYHNADLDHVREKLHEIMSDRDVSFDLVR